MILCPKCGKVNEYRVKESAHRVSVFNKNDECVKTTEYTGFRYDKPRCAKCGYVVDFFIDSQESEEQK